METAGLPRSPPAILALARSLSTRAVSSRGASVVHFGKPAARETAFPPMSPLPRQERIEPRCRSAASKHPDGVETRRIRFVGGLGRRSARGTTACRTISTSRSPADATSSARPTTTATSSMPSDTTDWLRRPGPLGDPGMDRGVELVCSTSARSRSGSEASGLRAAGRPGIVASAIRDSFSSSTARSSKRMTLMSSSAGAPSASGTAPRARLRLALRTEPDPDGLNAARTPRPGTLLPGGLTPADRGDPPAASPQQR